MFRLRNTMLRSRVLLITLFFTLVAGAMAQDATARAVNDLTKDGLLSFILASLVAGLFALTTPCVFPMIPVTVSFFAKQGEKSPELRLKGPISYCLGIISTFMVVGVAFGSIFGVADLNRFAVYWVTNLVLGALFVVLALSLFGLFEISMPSWIIRGADSGRKKGGLIASFAMGLTFALTSFSCTIAFVATLLTFAAKGGSFAYPILGMGIFSLTFALPFFLLALFPTVLAKMPKSGSWMVILKGFMGFIELMFAVKFFQMADLNLKAGWFTLEVFTAVWMILLVMAGLYLFGILKIKGHEGKPGPLRLGFGVLTFLFAISLSFAYVDKLPSWASGFLPPKPYPYEGSENIGGPVAKGELEWVTNDIDKAKAQAKKENKLIFIDFTGYNCVNCRKMEQQIFPREKVKEAMSKYVLLRLYTDDIFKNPERSEKYQELQTKLVGAISLPYYVIVDAEVNPLFAHRDYEPDETKFISFLNQDTSYKVASK